jgi:hypothetical protein
MDFKRNIGREAGFYSMAGSGINKYTMAICGKVIHEQRDKSTELAVVR